MLRYLIIPALLSTALPTALAPVAAQAQSAQSNPPIPNEEELQRLPQKIHDELTAKGFKDVKVVPGSFIVSGKDKDGNPVMLVIGPNSMSMMTGTPESGGLGPPSIAESPDKKDDLIQQ
jgi:hypothetical protein